MAKAVTLLTCDDPWSSRILPLKLPSCEVHVWRLGLEQANFDISQLTPILSHDERIKAASFRFERDRWRFIIGRGILRKILASYIGTNPDQIEFYYGAYGKPFLKGFGSEDIHFNLTHSHYLILYAFARHRMVGIDVEHCRSVPEFEQMAHRILSVTEKLRFKLLRNEQRTRVFLERWTLQEAKVKAMGIGLNEPNRHDCISNHIDELCPSEVNLDRRSWSIVPLAPAPCYTGSLAVEGHGWRLRFFHFKAS
jgi:4'-phosphopantetheinyl transferase